jgi:hypothetical protein
MGDDYITHRNCIKISVLENMKQFLSKYISDGTNYLIISDCNALKNHLKDIPNFYIFLKPIQHLGGESLYVNDDCIKNTLLDFYLIGNGNSCVSYSVYDHGSGFARYSSIINNIPVQNIKISI